MSAVTDQPKRYKPGRDRPKHGEYVFVCPACNGLSFTLRRDAITCSPRCRVWLHRHPECLADLIERSQMMKISIAQILQGSAVVRLCSDEVQAAVLAGTMSMGEAQDIAHVALVALVMQQGREE